MIRQKYNGISTYLNSLSESDASEKMSSHLQVTFITLIHIYIVDDFLDVSNAHGRHLYQINEYFND